MYSVREKERETLVEGTYDVIVCGGGPAGIAAAISSAREGAKTLLIELGGSLGGVWTSGLLSYVLDNAGKGGISKELIDRLQAYIGYLPLPHPAGNSTYDGSADYSYDAESMKHLLDEMCLEAGVDVWLHTRVVSALVNEDKQITTIMTESFSGRIAFHADVFVDCTGNGDLGALAGASYDIGHPETSQIQPATLMAIVSGVPSTQKSTLQGAAKLELYHRFVHGGYEPSYKKPVLFRLPHPDLCAIMLNHQYGVSSDSTSSITKATQTARTEIRLAVMALSRNPGWQQVRIVQTGNQLGLREGRRLHGHYQVTVEDLLRGEGFTDGVCRVMLPVDIHALDASEESRDAKRGVKALPYEIPYRSLVSSEIVNLLMAGRCISGDFYAHASYRVTGNAVPLGEAAGLAAAWTIRQGIVPHKLDGKIIKQEMIRRGYQMISHKGEELYE